MFCAALRKYCGESRRMSFIRVRRPTSIAEICGDDESAQRLQKNIKSWLVKFPTAGFQKVQSEKMGPAPGRFELPKAF